MKEKVEGNCCTERFIFFGDIFSVLFVVFCIFLFVLFTVVFIVY